MTFHSSEATEARLHRRYSAFAPALRHAWRRSQAPDARFGDLVAVLLLTARWDEVAGADGGYLEDAAVLFGEQLDALRLNPATTSRSELHRLAEALAPAKEGAVGAFKGLADILVLLTAGRSGLETVQ